MKKKGYLLQVLIYSRIFTKVRVQMLQKCEITRKFSTIPRLFFVGAAREGSFQSIFLWGNWQIKKEVPGFSLLIGQEL